jgi:hypothetical protein
MTAESSISGVGSLTNGTKSSNTLLKTLSMRGVGICGANTPIKVLAIGSMNGIRAMKQVNDRSRQNKYLHYVCYLDLSQFPRF